MARIKSATTPAPGGVIAPGPVRPCSGPPRSPKGHEAVRHAQRPTADDQRPPRGEVKDFQPKRKKNWNRRTIDQVAVRIRCELCRGWAAIAAGGTYAVHNSNEPDNPVTMERVARIKAKGHAIRPYELQQCVMTGRKIGTAGEEQW